MKVGVGFAITGTTLPTTSTVISLTSSKPTVLPVPANVTVPAGSTSTSFDTVAGPDCGNATITASLTDSFGVVSGSGPGGSIAVVPPGCRVLAPAPPSPPPPAPGPPTITSFTPTNGPIGTAVTITGTNLASVTQVGFNSFGTTFRALSATTIVAVVPSASATGLIEVINNAFGANTGFSSTAFTVTASAPPAPPPPPPPPVVSSITITRSELNAGQLRLEGTGAKPNAPLTVNGQALGTADATGAFRLQTTGFSAPGCTATVSDGTSSATAPLAGC